MRVRNIVLLGFLGISACQAVPPETPDPAALALAKKAHKATMERDAQAKENASAEQQAQIDAFLAQSPVHIGALGDVPLRPLTKGMAITAAVESFETFGRAEPIIIGVNHIAWPYGLSQPIMACAVLRVCSIALQEGEDIYDIVVGDSQRWNITVASSHDSKGNRPHIMVKPLSEGKLKTNLLVTTNKRAYHIELHAVEEGNYTPMMEFYYPSEPLVSVTHAQHAPSTVTANSASAEESSTQVAIHQMDFAYTLRGNKRLSWYPRRVFNDGHKTFVQMDHHIQTGDVPVFVIDDHGTPSLVNYRYKEPYYVIDRIFDKGFLMLGNEDGQDVVTILRQ